MVGQQPLWGGSVADDDNQEESTIIQNMNRHIQQDTRRDINAIFGW